MSGADPATPARSDAASALVDPPSTCRVCRFLPRYGSPCHLGILAEVGRHSAARKSRQKTSDAVSHTLNTRPRRPVLGGSYLERATVPRNGQASPVRTRSLVRPPRRGRPWRPQGSGFLRCGRSMVWPLACVRGSERAVESLTDLGQSCPILPGNAVRTGRPGPREKTARSGRI